ncbi:hypothetical protein [uncultured Nonlabens sp.]|uniref:OB-fold protein n=1 Tax=uncultured Nonlabens sp. TaxID=859306 RepID=UPI00262C7B3C|nr:hypothetical protein [uncultured Nonlabens sp.]
MKKIFIILFVLIVGIALGGYFYLYQDHRNVTDSVSVASFDTESLLNLFTDNDLENEKEFLDQFIEITGFATDKSAHTILLDDKIFIELTTSKKFRLNESYTIKGRLLGYDDLLEEVKIDQAIFINNQN